MKDALKYVGAGLIIVLFPVVLIVGVYWAFGWETKADILDRESRAACVELGGIILPSGGGSWTCTLLCF